MISFTQFKTDFPEFANATNGQFTTWSVVAAYMLTPAWGSPGPDTAGNPTIYDLGCELFIAHNIALSMQAAQQATAGGVPGLSRGVINSESVGPVSVGYDASAGLEPDAGHWNITTYGKRFIQMLRLIGAGPTMAAPGGTCNPLNGPAWVGPYPYPGYFG